MTLLINYVTILISKALLPKLIRRNSMSISVIFLSGLFGLYFSGYYVSRAIKLILKISRSEKDVSSAAGFAGTAVFFFGASLFILGFVLLHFKPNFSA